MEQNCGGKIIKGVGGLYTVRADGGETVLCRARGAFRHENIGPEVGDNVELRLDDSVLSGPERTDGGGAYIVSVRARRNLIERPPMANLDLLTIVAASSCPEPATGTMDRLISICETRDIEPAIVISKSELSPDVASRLEKIYTLAGYRVFVTDAERGEGIEALSAYVKDALKGKTMAFAGASGVGKSTLLNLLFPELSLAVSSVSRKTGRGRHTTRSVELHETCGGYIADTPGFSMLDLAYADYLTKEELPYSMREFRPYLGLCRYKKCTHTKEEGCAVLAAVESGEIAKERHESFLLMYDELKNKHEWNKNQPSRRY